MVRIVVHGHTNDFDSDGEYDETENIFLGIFKSAVMLSH